MDLEVGENVIGKTSIRENSKLNVEEAFKIHLHPDGQLTLTPSPEVSCYIKSNNSLYWKLLSPESSAPLSLNDTCLLYPSKIWLKVISTMNDEDESISSAKRKQEEVLEGEPPDKKLCSQEANEEYLFESDEINDKDLEFGMLNNVTDNNCDLESADDDISLLIKCTDADTIANSIEDTNRNESSSESNEADLPSRLDHSNLKEEPSNIENPSLHTELNTDIEEDEEDVAIKRPSDVPLLQLVSTDSVQPELKQTPDTKTSDSVENTTDSTSEPINQAIPSREKCKYGSECYRLNVEHKTQFSHPGDDDYDAPDSRPECPYGVDCYRKNPQHKLDYKHTSTRRRQTRPARPSRSPNPDDYEEDSYEESVDESEYEPSFIDDDSIDSHFSDDPDEE